ncbi:MAG: 50S ribosomal protein L23 [Bacillota bacterium]|jgi:large subunit ribosomal protein L23|nr:50S ribosomal protein L23 [Eubacteriales bacterium]MDI9491591.1 50S ribosomal protein L23 [Bacillota bacterium]NLV70650.1 50S ribosomal protein L23 [Clostridiales bacterium]HPF18130.1 50S ribosomal protein L23 [Bacillota bacterium]
MRTPYDVLIKPVISERSMDDAQAKKYTFKVAVDANKTEIKSAVEEAFGVEVVKVNVMNNDGKVKRQGKYVGRTASYKKAIVTLSEKSKAIEFFEGL